ncbi:hypothetical protein [Sedimentisphaera cyanobacteriorum]|nr:hypothetical protein [Sedimentisphaera cyanobacteriorum]
MTGLIIVFSCVAFVLITAFWASSRIKKMSQNGYGSARYALKNLRKGK